MIYVVKIILQLCESLAGKFQELIANKIPRHHVLVLHLPDHDLGLKYILLLLRTFYHLLSPEEQKNAMMAFSRLLDAMSHPISLTPNDFPFLHLGILPEW